MADADKRDTNSSKALPRGNRNGENGYRYIAEAAAKSLATREASISAVHSQRRKVALAGTATEYVTSTHALMQFQVLTLQAQLDFLEDIAGMDYDEKLSTLFNAFDEDESGKVDATSLVARLRTIDSDIAFAKTLECSIVAVAPFDAETEATLDRAGFKRLLFVLLEELECTFDELAKLLAMHVLFKYDLNSTSEMGDGTIAVGCAGEYDSALLNERMQTLFKLFDINGTESISYSHVALSLFQITETFDETAKEAIGALLLFDKNEDRRTLDYPGFASLIFNVDAAFPEHLTFDDIADSLTMAVCQHKDTPDPDLLCLFVADDVKLSLIDLQQEGHAAAALIDPLQYCRIERLFNIWDLDHNNTIDFSEFVLGMRKFHEAKHIDETLEESIQVMLTFDEDKDQTIDLKEFTLFLAKFAHTSGVRLAELVDFMLVRSALKDNDEAEKLYVESIGATASEQLRRFDRQKSSRRMLLETGNSKKGLLGAVGKARRRMSQSFAEELS